MRKICRQISVISALVLGSIATPPGLFSGSAVALLPPPGDWSYPRPEAPVLISEIDNGNGVTLIFDVPAFPGWDSRYMSGLVFELRHGGLTGSAASVGWDPTWARQWNFGAANAGYNITYTASLVFSTLSDDGTNWIRNVASSVTFRTMWNPSIPTTTTTTTVATSTTVSRGAQNPCTDPANPKYACGWAAVSDTGQVSGVSVCTFEVCGSGFFGGQRKVLQTRQEVGGNVAGYNSGFYDFATNRFYPFGVDGAWFTGGDTWEDIRASLQATDSTSTTVSRRTTTTLPTDSVDEDSSTSTLPRRGTTTTTVARRGSTTTVAKPIEEDDGESEEDYAELSVRNEGTKFRVQVFSSFVDTDMVIRARRSGKVSVTWRFSTDSSGNHRFVTNRPLSGYVLSLWIDDERVDSLRVR